MYAEYQKGIDNFTIDPVAIGWKRDPALEGENSSQVERDKEITRLQQRDAQREKELSRSY